MQRNKLESKVRTETIGNGKWQQKNIIIENHFMAKQDRNAVNDRRGVDILQRRVYPGKKSKAKIA